MRRNRWFSSGAASAVAVSLDIREHGLPTGEVVICDTGSEDEDNWRFARDVEVWLDTKMLVLKSDEYDSTWDVWEKTGWISGPEGARCTGELKAAVRLAYQRPDDIHIFGYTADREDTERAARLREAYPELTIVTPLIDRGITKAGCLAIMETVGIALPRSYAWGFPNANCLESGCAKAQSPRYWALHRQMKPEGFARTAAIARAKGVKMAIMGQEIVDGKRVNVRGYIDDIPLDHPTTDAIAPVCDFLCHMATMDLGE